jgi:hypothetical protein
MRIIYDLAQGPREPSIKKLVEQNISVIKNDVVVLIRGFEYVANEVHYELAIFRNNDKMGLIEV